MRDYIIGCSTTEGSHLSKQNGTASEGDVILTVDNITVRNTGDVLVYLLKEKKVGDNVKLSIFRKGQIHGIDLKLGSTSCPTTVVTSTSKTALDSNGVLMYDYGGSIGKVYNIVMLENAALKNYQKYITSGDKMAKESFINTSNWLVDHSVNHGNYSLWEYDYPWPFYRCLFPPYSSALAQAQGIWVLLLAYNVTAGDTYLVSAKNAYGAFLNTYDKGGVVSTEKGDSIFLQEIAKPGYTKTYVLNGHISSIIFLMKYYQLTHDNRAAIIIDKGLRYLRGNLGTYDTGSWSYYDHMKNLAPLAYQQNI